jgi:hypothetical protein
LRQIAELSRVLLGESERACESGVALPSARCALFLFFATALPTTLPSPRTLKVLSHIVMHPMTTRGMTCGRIGGSGWTTEKSFQVLHAAL